LNFKKLRGLEWDAIAGIIAAVVAIALELLHVVDEHVILPIVLVLIALLFVNFMRHVRSNESTAEQVERTEHAVRSIQSALKQPEVILVGPLHLRSANEHFIRQMSGDSIWFNVCLSMYRTQPLFDALLRPALDNPMVSSIRFVLDEGQRDAWQRFVKPLIDACPGRAKVLEPNWRNLGKNVSYILANSQVSGGTEALLSFWGEPFMARATGHDVPRFIFHVQSNSELLPHLVELQRNPATSQAE